MVLGRRHWIIVALVLLLVVLLTACERPLGSDESESVDLGAEATAVAEMDEGEDNAQAAADDEAEAGDAAVEEAEAQAGAEEAESSDPDVGGGTPDTAAEESADSAEAVQEGEQASTDEAVTEDAAAEEAGAEADSDASQEDATGSEADAAAAEGESDEVSTAEETAEADASAAEGESTAATEESVVDAPARPATHTVAAGENLYRIGLKYGVSWVLLAAYNQLPNANYIREGQVLQIPGGVSEPLPSPTPDATGHIDYLVQLGDTLNKIGQKYGVSWLEIAEANGLVNPNLIYAGQVLKIPTNEPEDPPAMTHTVKPGETLYRISLQYGVHWLAIAQANDIAPPHVIYPGQVLTLPGG